MSFENKKLKQIDLIGTYCCICQEDIDIKKRDATIRHANCNNVSHKSCLKLWKGCNKHVCPGCGGFCVDLKPLKLNVNLATSSMISDERINILIETLDELNLKLRNSRDIKDKVKRIRLLCKVYHEVANFFQKY